MVTIITQWFTKTCGVFLSAMMFVFIFSACTSEPADLPEEEPTDLPKVQRRLDNQQLISYAVFRVFDGKGTSVKSASPDLKSVSCFPPTKFGADDQTPIIKYAFDFIQINDAVRFVAQKIDFPFLNEICGEGEIEVFLTSFKTFVYADETKDINHLEPYIPDDLIVFRGELGIYSCMSNGGSWWSDYWNDFMIIEYSSHKRFSGNAIEKDITPPLYQFYVKTENNTTMLGCSESGFFGDPSRYSGLWTILEGGDVVSSEELFTPEELTSLSAMSQQCTITGIGEDYFLVSGEGNLEKIYFDEYTLFFADKQPAESTDFAVGDEVIVTFNKPYEKYNPKVVVANTIVKD